MKSNKIWNAVSKTLTAATVMIIVTLVLASAAAAAVQRLSLSGNWSNTANPNGPWSYNQGSSALPLVTDWTASGTAFVGCNQPAWAPSNNAGSFLPALMKANSCTAKDLGTDPHNGGANVLPGDIVVHTVDGSNGNPALGVANVLFTLPAGEDGTYQMRGSVWDAGLFYGTSRPQDWTLLVNGVKQASGVLSGTVSRSEAQTFSVIVTLHGGDTVELQLFMDAHAAAGFFVGTNMTIGPLKCALTDSLSYNATTGALTMKFTLGTPAAVTWNGWLTSQNGMQKLWSQSRPITEPAVTVTKTQTGVAKAGNVGVLSTLTTPTGGITCSSWQLVNTGTP